MMSTNRRKGLGEMEHCAAVSSASSEGPPAGLGLRTHFDALREIAGEVSGLRIVDLGCGEGNLARELADNGAEVTGVDPLVAPVPEQNYGNGSFRILRASAEAVALPSGSIDIVTFIFSLHHLPADVLEAGLREARRLLRPSGRLYVAEPLAEGPLYYLTQPFHDERAARANAFRALEGFVAPEFEAIEAFHYLERRMFADFHAFATRMTANARFNDYSIEDVKAPEVARRFDELFARCRGNFDQPVLVNLYSRPRNRTP